MHKGHVLMAYQVGGVKGGSGVAYPQLKSSNFVFDPANSKLVNVSSEPEEIGDGDYMQMFGDGDIEEFVMSTDKFNNADVNLEELNSHNEINDIVHNIFDVEQNEPDNGGQSEPDNGEILDSIFAPESGKSNVNRVVFNEEVVECNFYKSEPVKCIGEAVRAAEPNAILSNIFN